ncbi:MAG TPA: HupE/UreJ family protein, partial [Alphaproteobacteria bacterium]|nr:HupE/UreJ family protein [Alphaproteobacteria bacterium]
EDGARLAPVSAWQRVSQPSENRFGTFAEARAHVLGPALPEKSNVFWNQGYLDVALEYAIRSDRSAFALDILAWSGLSGRVKVFVQYLPPRGDPRVFQVHGGHGWLELDPSWYGAASTFVVLGFEHILGGIDHLLFLLCLLLPFRMSHIWHLAGIITAFTVAHSITLIASAMGAVPTGNWFPPLIEALIAISILYMACENIISSWLQRPVDALRWRWLIAGFFGLIHGFGFSFVLEQDLQYAGPHILVSLIAFNLGVEVGQLAFLMVVLPSLVLALRRLDVQRIGVILISAVVAHTAWHWMLERGSALRFVRWPTLEVSWNTIWLLAIVIMLVGATSVLVLRALRSKRAPWSGARDQDPKGAFRL